MRIQEKDLDDPRAWRFWRGGGEESFTGKFTDPYTQKGGAMPAIIHFGGGPEGTWTSPSQPVPRYVRLAW